MRERRRWVAAWLLAAVLHLQALALVGLLVWRFGPKASDLDGPLDAVSVQTVDDETARNILAELDRAEEKAREEEERKEREATTPPGQVVELPPPREPAERPRKARFVSEHDSTVEKETKRQGRSPGAAPEPGLLAMREPPSSRAAPMPPSPEAEPARPAPRPTPPAPPATAPPAAAPMPVDPEGALPAPPPRADVAPAPPRPPEDTAPGTHPPSLLPTSTQLANALAGGGSLDNLDDIDDGDVTALNAKSWKFASFFNRVKRQVAEHWKPGIEYERRDPTGQVYGTGSWVTFLRIVLKPDGALAGVVIQKTSGLEFLDDVAVEAVKRGQPYPNPPPQLVDPDSGVINFKFGFYFDVGSSPRMKIYRYPTL